MKNLLRFSLAGLLLCIPVIASAQANFGTSLHATREGKNDAYKAENGGMELITNIPMSELSCQKCHSTNGLYADSTAIDPATYSPGCKDCHDFSKGNTVAEQTCISCHNRQNYERAAYPDMDVHKAAGMTCTNCHSEEEIHGDDGIAYASLKQEGAIKAKCENCHTELSSNTAHNLHAGTVDCAACHAVAVLTCASCHFESVVATGKNRALNQLKNYKLLVKRDGEVRLGAFMTHSYAGKTNYIISSYHSHAIQKDATSCADCHYNLGATNAAIAEYNNTGQITMTKWNEDTKKMAGPTGVVPIPADWETALKMDFATYTGDSTVFPSDPNAWVYLKSEVDNAHLFYAEPLDSLTLAKLGVTRFPTTSVADADLHVPNEFALMQNYPNPFNPLTTIEFSLDNHTKVSLSVYDLNGREIAVLMKDQIVGAGTHKLKFDASNLPSGVYMYVLSTPNFKQSRKMILMK